MKIETKTAPPNGVQVSMEIRGAVVRRVADDRLCLVGWSSNPETSKRWMGSTAPRAYLIDLETGEYQRYSRDTLVVVQDAVLKVSGDAS
jgi:hypothetical protein